MACRPTAGQLQVLKEVLKEVHKRVKTPESSMARLVQAQKGAVTRKHPLRDRSRAAWRSCCRRSAAAAPADSGTARCRQQVTPYARDSMVCHYVVDQIELQQSQLYHIINNARLQRPLAARSTLTCRACSAWGATKNPSIMSPLLAAVQPPALPLPTAPAGFSAIAASAPLPTAPGSGADATWAGCCSC